MIRPLLMQSQLFSINRIKFSVFNFKCLSWIQTFIVLHATKLRLCAKLGKLQINWIANIVFLLNFCYQNNTFCRGIADRTTSKQFIVFDRPIQSKWREAGCCDQRKRSFLHWERHLQHPSWDDARWKSSVTRPAGSYRTHIEWNNSVL